MNLIRSIRVRGFRSIEDVSLEEPHPFTVLVGGNNSGKSNLLRALNLFFADEPEPGRALDFGVDHHTIPQRKKRKEIIVAVGFDLSEFTPPKAIAPQVQTALGTRFVLQKKWDLSKQREPQLEVTIQREGEDALSPADRDAVRSLLALVNFRYIPNRTIPTQTLASHRPEITRAISMRVGRTESEAAQGILTKIGEAAKAALLEVDDDISGAMEGISQIQAGVPDTIAGLISMGGFRAQSALGTPVGDEAWGSGAQAFLMFSVLHAVDRDRSGYFGWRQGTIWAVEEPESSLHHDLAVTLAGRFHDWSSKTDDRIQILCTTHSEVFTMCADRGFEVTLNHGKTQASPRPIPLLVSAAARSGVTSWPQPLLAFPFSPLVFVEGTIDSRVLTHASRMTGIAAKCVFLSPSELDPAVGDGADSVASYLQKFGNLWEKRPPDSPLLVLFDWDTSSNSPAARRATKVFGNQAEDRVFVMDPAGTDPEMSEQWRGIERFYPAEFIERAKRDGVVNAGRDDTSKWLITQSELSKAKRPLSERLCRSSDPDDFQYLKRVLQEVDARISTLTAGYYQATLSLGEA